MLHIIYGTDKEKARARFRVLREEFVKKGSSERIVMEGEVNRSFLDEASSSRGIFGETTLFVFDSVFDKKDEQEILAKHVVDLASSANIFLILETTFDKETMKTVIESVATIEEFAGKKIDKRPDFNIFSLGDALGKRNKKELWVLYQEAVASGFEPEEVCSTLFWAVKNIALMKSAKPGEDAGLSPYIAPKARMFAKNYTQDEIANISRTLVSVYHEAHRGGEPMSIALERFILEL